MKKFILLTFAAFIIATQTSAEILKRVMNCKITDQVILESNEGQPKRYTGFTNMFEVGDSLRFELASKSDALLYAELRDTVRNKAIIETAAEKSYREFTLRKNIFNEYAELQEVDALFVNRFTENSIELEGILWRLELRRYYKSDFHGIMVRKIFADLLAGIATLDCRMVIDEFDEILAGFTKE